MVAPHRQRILHLWVALCGVVMLALSVAEAQAAETIEVTLDRIQVQVGEPITVTAKVNGRVSGAIKLPNLPDYVVTRGPSQRSVTNIVNFQVQRYTEYTWTLSSRKPGTFEFGPITATVDGKTTRSAAYPFAITVGTKEKSSGARPDVFVTASVEPKVAYPGQQVIYTLRIHRAVQVTNYRYAPPAFDGFLEEPMDENAQTETTTEIGGRPYVVKEVRHALFPTRAGTLEIGSATIIAEVLTERRNRRRRNDPFDVFFDSPFGGRAEQRELIAEPIKMRVKPLPPGAPDGFYGLVGDFDIDWKISSRKLAQGASSTLTIDIEGTGNIRDIKVPDLSLEGFKVYEDSPALQLAFDPRSRRLKGQKQFKLALIPLESGRVTLPPATLPFFDPSEGKYRTVSTQPIPLAVTEGSGEEDAHIATQAKQREGGREVTILGEDILPLKTIDDPHGAEVFGPAHPAALGLFMGPPLAYLGLVLFLGWRERDAADPAARRRRRALPEALAAIKAARGAIADDPKEAFRSLDRAVTGFLADRLSLEGRALTPREAQELIASRGASEDLQGDVKRLLEALEQAQYMPATTASDAASARCDEAIDILKRLDRELP